MQPIPEIHHLRLAHHRVQEIWPSRARTPRRDPQASSANDPLLRESREKKN
jgi:hypothetical protein